MKAEDKLALLAAAQAAKTSVPGLQAKPRGILVLGCGLHFFGGIAMPQIDFGELTADDWTEDPRANEDPIALLFTMRRFREDVTVEALLAVRSWEDLAPFIFDNADHRLLRAECVQEATTILKECGRAIAHPTSQKKHHRYRCILGALSFSGPERIATAQKWIEAAWKAEKRAIIKFPKNWRASKLGRRTKTPLGEYLGLGSQPRPGTSVPVKGTRVQSVPEPTKVEEINSVARGKQFRKESDMLISACPAPGQLTKGQIRDIIQGCMARLGELAFLILALSIVTLQPFGKLLRFAEVPVLVDGTYKSKRPFRKLHDPPSGGLALPAARTVPIYWPPQLAEPYLQCAADGGLSGLAVSDVQTALRELCEAATFAKIRASLVTHGATSFVLSWSWLHLAANPRRRPPAPVHYNRVGVAQLLKLQTFLSFFDCQLDGLVATDAFGSSLVVDTAFVRELFSSWRFLILQPLPGNLQQAVVTWNILAAGAFYLTALLCGLRTHELPPPSLLYATVWPAIEIFQQKGRSVAAYYPRRLRCFFRLLAQRAKELRQKAESEGVAFNLGGLENAVFYHVETAAFPLRLICVSPSPGRANKAFAQDATFKKFENLWATWPRHWSNTILREAALNENLVQRFHNHSPQSFHSLRWDHGVSVFVELNEYVCEYISSIIGL
jgi:hypothetical protein